MNRKIVFYVIFFFALVFIFLYGLTRWIPGFGEVKLPVIGYVHPFHFTDQNGKSITQDQVKGKVYVAEFFFTTCKGICPKLNNNIKKIYSEFPKENDLLFLSHTVDPETDSVPRLKTYADSMGIDGKRWHLLTGSKDSLYYAARASYLLDDPKNNSESIDQQFLHTQLFALIDRKGRVRKIYDGLKTADLKELKKDIQELLKES
ncbi:MAG: SCO family protein [Chitinophagaceae bacterium]